MSKLNRLVCRALSHDSPPGARLQNALASRLVSGTSECENRPQQLAEGNRQHTKLRSELPTLGEGVDVALGLRLIEAVLGLDLCDEIILALQGHDFLNNFK